MQTSGLKATLYTEPAGAERGGDIHYLSVCSHDTLTRILLADVRGHGEGAEQLSQWLYTLLLEHLDSLPGSPILAEVNRIVCGEGLHALATGVVLTYNKESRLLHVANGGHPAPLLRQGRKGWEALEIADPPGPANLPLGILPTAIYTEAAFRVEAEDRLFLYTDGLTECPAPSGDFFDFNRIESTLTNNSYSELSVLKENMLNALDHFAPPPRAHDDCTFLAVDFL